MSVEALEMDEVVEEDNALSYGDLSVLDQLLPEEKWVDDSGNVFPKVKPLRKLVTNILGPIQENITVNNCEPGFCNVTATMTIRLNSSGVKYYRLSDDDDRYIEVSATADVTQENGGDFARYAAAFADTRACGRCYVKALGLNVVTKEEMCPTNGRESVQSVEVQTESKDTSAIRVMAATYLKRINHMQSTKASMPDLESYFEFNLDTITDEEWRKISGKIRKLATTHDSNFVEYANQFNS